MTARDTHNPSLCHLEGAPGLQEFLGRRLEGLRLGAYGLLDRLAVALDGGLRLRVLRTRGLAGSRLGAWVHGRVPGPPPDRILAEVLALDPDGPGTLHLRHDGEGDWSVRAGGRLADPVFQQRLRNVLVNS